MRVLMTGGGTGGHVNPAVAIANIVREKEPDSEIAFVFVVPRSIPMVLDIAFRLHLQFTGYTVAHSFQESEKDK